MTSQVPKEGNNTAPPTQNHSRLKRVAVTSCDSCRLRKLKCNAKELPSGSTCGSCARHEWKCTFEDSKESLTRPTTRMRHKIHRNPNPPQPGIYPQHFMTPSAGATANQPRQGFAGAHDQASAMMGHNRYTNNNYSAYSHAGFSNSQEISQLAEQLWPDAHNQAAGPYAPFYAWTDGPTFPGAQPQLPLLGGVGHASASTSLRTAAVDFNGPSFADFALPHALTEPQSGYTRAVTPQEISEILLMRFYADSTSSAYILPRKDVFHRYLTGTPAPLPEYLLQTLLAASAFLPTTKEPELLAWRPHGWSIAVKTVQARLRSRIPADLHLIQALLLLGNGWIGDPDDNERTVIFEMAFRLALSIGLNSSNTNITDPDERSARIMLFWIMYVLDRMLLVATGRPLIIGRTAHDVPAPTAADANIIALSAREDHSTQSDEHLWIHRQLLAFIALADILEDTHRTIQEIRASPSRTLAEILHRIMPIEVSLETWCKENKLLLRETAAVHGPLCQNLTESMVAQLHMCQLQLYQAPIRCEIEQAKSLPIYFDPSNGKSLTACVESAWYLVQQPLVNHDPSAAMHAIMPGSKPITQFNVANYAVLCAAQFLRLLSCTWAEWKAGRGLEEYTPRNAVEFAVAAQAPWGDVNVLQHQQAMAVRQQNFNQPHHTLPPEWKHSPQSSNVALAPVPEAFAQGLLLQQPQQASFLGTVQGFPNWPNIAQGSQGTTGLAHPERPSSVANAPSTASSMTAVEMISPGQGQTPIAIQGGVLAKDDSGEHSEMASNLPEVRPLAPPSSTTKTAGRKAAPKPLNLGNTKEGGSKLASKRKREVTFIVTDADSDRSTKLTKLDTDEADANEASVDVEEGDTTEDNGAAHLDVPPRTARLDTATLESFAFPLTPARFLFDASEFDLDFWNRSPQGGQNNKQLDGSLPSDQAALAGASGNPTADEGDGQQGVEEEQEDEDEDEDEDEEEDEEDRDEDGDEDGEQEVEEGDEEEEQEEPRDQQVEKQESTVSAAPNALGSTITGTSNAVLYPTDMLAPFNIPFTPSLGNFGATAAMMTPLRTEFMTNFRTALMPPPSTNAFATNAMPSSPSRTLDNFTNGHGLDLSAFGLKGVDGLDPLQGIFSNLSASDFAGLSATMSLQGPDYTSSNSNLGGSSAIDFSTSSWLDAFKTEPHAHSGNATAS
ncbi:hypothetical protein A4X13_0g3487 [Tilletia indica]|uniref:Uncharacterized protein n=1 Tax=Tilletia indica TaxID=43049 RepID=A0A177TAM2_9BASI|nr:hypothetical protein A4X13_0g3487 [Tilletia indica]